MIELTAAEKLAALIDGLDLQLRASFMAGFAGTEIPRSGESKFIKDLASERGWDLSPKWSSPSNSGLYTYLKSFIDGMKASGNDVLQEEFIKGKKSIFYAAGEESSTNDKWAEGIKSGKEGPFDLKGILTHFAKRKAISYRSKEKTHRRKEEENAYDIGDFTTPASGGGSRTMITDAILSGISSDASDEFIGWLKGLTGEMSPGAGKLMSAYLDLVLRGEAESDVEALAKLNASGAFNIPNPSYLGKVKKDFADTAADLLSGATKTRNPQLQRMRDMLSDASFLDELSKGHVPGSRAAKLNGHPRLLSAADYMAELEKASKFERGVSVSLDELPEELQENVENPPESVLDLRDEMEGKAAMFERGVPADPTKNMSAEDAAEWERQNREHADQFKTADSSDAESEYKTAVSRLAIAEKASRAVPVAEAERLRSEAMKLETDLSGKFHAAEKASRSSGHYAAPDADDVSKLKRYYAEVSSNLKMLSRIALRKGEVHRRLMQDASDFDRYDTNPDSLSNAAGLASVIASVAHYVAAKARRADELKNYYGRWIEFYKTNGRSPTYQQQMSFMPKSASTFRGASDKTATSMMERLQLLSAFQVLTSGNPTGYGIPRKDALAVIEKITGKSLPEDAKPPVSKSLDQYMNWLEESGKTASDSREAEWNGRSMTAAPGLYGFTDKTAARKPKDVVEKHQIKILLDTVRNPMKGKFLGGPSAEEAEETLRDTFGYSDAEIRKLKTAAAGLYGFTKSAEKSCTGAAGKLAKYAAKLAKELYTKDADTAPFMEEHAKRGFKTARMLRNAMADVGPGPAPKTKTAASKSGMGLYGFKDSTAKLAMNACSELHQAAGHLAADLAAKFGEKHADGAGFLKKHAKAAKCAFSDLILDSYPSAPVKVSTPKKAHLDPTVDEILAWDRAVGSRMATSFMASAEDDVELEAEVDTDVEADDLISSWGKTAFDMVRTAGTYQEYVERKKKKGEKPMSESDWESRVYGQLAKGRAHPRDQKKEAPTAEGKVTRPAPGKKWPKYEGERTWEKNYRAPAQHVMGAYRLKDEDAEELTKYSRDKPHNTFQKVSPQKLMAEFLRNAKPETKERMKGMSPKDFMIMLRSMTADEPVVEA